MSPLARIRQVATCTLFALLTNVVLVAFTLAAEPVQTPSSPTGALPAKTSDAGAVPAQAVAAASPVVLAPKATAQIARSALLTVDGTATDDSLRLSIRRTHDKSLVSGGDLSITVDGKNEPVGHEHADSFEIPINDLRGDGSAENAHDVEMIVPHDGIREILSGKLTATQGASATSLLGDHKQMAWWILNIAIVFIAATVLSRRKSN
jgi:hypothetical protein